MEWLVKSTVSPVTAIDLCDLPQFLLLPIISTVMIWAHPMTMEYKKLTFNIRSAKIMVQILI